jgi:hypothetical protein
MRKNIKYLTILFLLLVVYSCDDVIPETALCIDDAITMEKNYVMLKGFDKNPNHDNRIISFTHEQMESNLNYLTAQAEKRGISEEELGFRVYFAAKKEESFVKGKLKSIGSEEEAYSTVFFVATIKGESEDANDYKNIYEIPALNYGGSRRPPNNTYNPDPAQRCPLIGTNGHIH